MNLGKNISSCAEFRSYGNEVISKYERGLYHVNCKDCFKSENKSCNIEVSSEIAPDIDLLC